MRVLRALERQRVEYVLVGSMAMAAQGLVRATRGMDIFVNPSESNVHSFKAALRELFDDPEVEGIRSDELAGEYPAVQYVPPGGDFWIDILARLGEGFRFADLESEILLVEGVQVRVATPRMLYLMKKDTVRGQDRLDAEMLKERFGLEGE